MDHPDNTYVNENGQSLVELAISMMFLLLLVAGTIDLGRAFFTYIALRDAAQEGAAFASVARDSINDPMVCDKIITRAKETSDTNIVNLADTNVSILFNGVACPTSNANACYGRAVTVEVEYPDFQLVTPWMGTIVGSQTIPIRASIVDTVLTPSCH